MIFRLACLQIQSHRLRTVFAAVAAVLTSILYMTVISISYCILDSTQLSRMLAAGSDFHASVTDIGYSISAETLCREIKSAPEVSEAFLLGMRSAVSADSVYTGSGHQEMDIAFTDSEKSLSHLFMTPTKGQFPQSQDEIMLYEETFSAISVGDYVRLTYDCLNGKTMDRVYTVSGFYDCDADRPISAVTLYDENSVQEIGITAQVMITFHSGFGIDRRLEAVTERLGEWELPGMDVDSQINYAYAAADLGAFFQPVNVLLILFVVAVIFFAAFLLIYNIFSISLTQDMRTFGLLQVIGTTYRQMKRLTYVQIILIGCAALPIGLLLGYLIGFRLLSPIFMSLSGNTLPYRFSPWIVWISAGLTSFTLFFSALRPLKRIKKMTPIQAVSAESEEDYNKKDRRREIPISPRSLALAGIRRSRGRMLITSLSAMVSILLFVIVGGLVDGFIGSTINRLGRFDIDLSLEYQPENSGAISSVPPSFESPSFRAAIEPDVIEHFALSDAVEEMYLLRFERISAKIMPLLEEKIRAYLAQQKNEFVLKEYQDSLDSGLINSVVLGIPDELCQYLVVSGEDGKSIFYNGEELYDSRHVLYISTADYGQSFDPTYFYTGDVLSSDTLKINYEVIGAKLPYGIHTALAELCSCQYIGSYEALFLLPMSVFEKEFHDAPVFTILANAKEGMGETLREEVQEYANGRYIDFNGTSYLYHVSGKLNRLADLRVRLAALRLTGYSLCGIIFLIGLLNMVNSALTSMVLRRREFAMLETVGMTRAQLRKMLLYENSVGGVFGLVSFVVGSVLSNAMLTQTFGVDIALISLPAIGILLFLFAAGGITAELSYRMLTKTSLTERIRLGG
ncbi:MAG: ABC transporter permease [Lachnospiraceae bacterium]|jgi:putative ABC transport system permease protein|nr:ABC transporter permease [Lachnospiraceae bacterium]